MCCSEQAAETGMCSASVEKDIIGEQSCVGDIEPNASDHVFHAVDTACHGADAASDDATADDIMGVSTQDTSSQHIVDSAGTETDLSGITAQSEDEIQTDERLVKDDVGKLDEDVQSDSKEVHNKAMWYLSDIKKQWRKFNIDLMPKVIKGHSDHSERCSVVAKLQQC